MYRRQTLHLAKVDAKLARIIDKVGPCKLNPNLEQPPYEALVEAVVYQQLTGKAAETILGRFKALFPGETFPSPESVNHSNVEHLRTAGLSRATAIAIQDISRKTLEGIVPETTEISKMADQEIIDRLITI